MGSSEFFERCREYWWDGYFIKVRNSWNYHLDKVHITNVEKEMYEKEFGKNILYETEFYDWYFSLKKGK